MSSNPAFRRCRPVRQSAVLRRVVKSRPTTDPVSNGVDVSENHGLSRLSRPCFGGPPTGRLQRRENPSSLVLMGCRCSRPVLLPPTRGRMESDSQWRTSVAGEARAKHIPDKRQHRNDRLAGLQMLVERPIQNGTSSACQPSFWVSSAVAVKDRSPCRSSWPTCNTFRQRKPRRGWGLKSDSLSFAGSSSSDSLR